MQVEVWATQFTQSSWGVRFPVRISWLSAYAELTDANMMAEVPTLVGPFPRASAVSQSKVSQG